MLVGQTQTIAPWTIFSTLGRHRALIWQMARREVIGRYRGSTLGVVWSFITPLLMLAVYTYAFGGILRVNAPPATTAPSTDAALSAPDFAAFIFAGLIVHLLFADCLIRSPTLILSNPSYVKKVVFPLEILPWVALGAALFHAVVSLTILLAASAVFHHGLPWTIIFAPLPIACLCLMIVGISWFLSSIGVFLRDTSHTISIATWMLMFVSPVFYLDKFVLGKPRLQFVMNLNPTTFIMRQLRLVVLDGKLPNFAGLALYFAIALTIAYLGLLWFNKTRKGFADVI